MGKLTPRAKVEMRGAQLEPTLQPPRIEEISFEDELGAFSLTNGARARIISLHDEHTALTAHRLAAQAIGEILRSAGDCDHVCAVLARQLGVIDATLPDLAERFSRSKQALHAWHKLLKERFRHLKPYQPKRIAPSSDSIPWSQAHRVSSIPRRRLADMRRHGEIKVMNGRDGTSLWVSRDELRRVEREEEIKKAQQRTELATT